MCELVYTIEYNSQPGRGYRNNVSVDELASMLDAETWLNGSEALDLGFADEVLDSSKAKNMNQIALVAMASSDNKYIKYDMSKLAKKVQNLSIGSSDIRRKLDNAQSLSDIEKTLRNELKASCGVAAAISANYKRLCAGYQSDSEDDVIALINNAFNEKLGE